MALRHEGMLARYSLWANDVIYAVVAGLPETAVAQPRDTTFGSILRTLGHSYAVGAIFQAHLQGRAHGFAIRNVPDATTFGELRAMQRELDAWYVARIDTATDEDLDARIGFQFVDGGEGAMTQREMLLHVVNHNTFHRGFLVDTLRAMATPVPATDLTVYIGDHNRQ